tara:strand:+ start:1962 stop:2339 length:378 start_codon:yes stop_codon:yes gene_type:complete
MNIINEDVQGHIVSFLNVEDYQASKLYLRHARCKAQEQKLQLFEELFRAIPARVYCILGGKCKNQKRLLRDTFVRHDMMDFDSTENFLDLGLKQRIQRGTPYKITFYRKKHVKSTPCFHFLLWRN